MPCLAVAPLYRTRVAFSKNHNAYTSYKQPWMQLSIYFRGHVYQIFAQMMSHVYTDALELISHCLNCSCKVFDCSHKKHQRSHAVSAPTVCRNREWFLSFSSEQKPFWGQSALPHFNSKWTGAWKKPLVLVFLNKTAFMDQCLHNKSTY